MEEVGCQPYLRPQRLPGVAFNPAASAGVGSAGVAFSCAVSAGMESAGAAFGRATFAGMASAGEAAVDEAALAIVGAATEGSTALYRSKP